MKQFKIVVGLLSVCVLVGCTPDERPTEKRQVSEEPEVSQVTVTNNDVIDQTTSNVLTFDQHEYQYDVVSGATQTTFGTTPPAIYSKEEKKNKMFWSNQPPLGLLTGDYYKNEGTFTGGNYGVVEIVTNKEDHKIANVEFTEFASEPYYDPTYSGANKRLSDYAFFQASNTRTDETLVTVVNGITFVEKQMRDDNRVTGDFLTVKGSSTSARDGLMSLAAALDGQIRQASDQHYQGYAEELDSGLIARLEVITSKGKIEDVSYDEYFADREDKMKDENLKPFYRQSKYYSIAYNQQTGNEFIEFADQLVSEIKEKQTLSLEDEHLTSFPSFEAYQRLAAHIKLN